jgi:hypothetical protein
VDEAAIADYVGELDELLARVRRAGLPMELAGPTAELVRAAVRRAERKGEAVQPPLAWIARELDRTGRRFTLWHADAEGVIAEVRGFLELAGVAGAVDEGAMRSTLGAPQAADGMNAAYGAAVAAVNGLLARSGDPRRLFELPSLSWEPADEPLWLLLSLAQLDGLKPVLAVKTAPRSGESHQSRKP